MRKMEVERPPQTEGKMAVGEGGTVLKSCRTGANDFKFVIGSEFNLAD